jgi:adenylate kinase family enzyme
MTHHFKLLITGGPGAGASTTGERLSTVLEIPWIDSDDYFHKPTNPPFQVQYSREERSHLIHKEFDRFDSWILSGSISAWDIHDVEFTHAVLLGIGPELRLKRLKAREHERFGVRIEAGGDMHEDHMEFMKWAASYESGELEGRSLSREKAFMAKHCTHILLIEEQHSLDELEKMIVSFVSGDHPRQNPDV